MANSGNNTLARIVFGLAIVVFLVAVGWTVNSAVKAYDLHRERVAAKAETRAARETEQPAAESDAGQSDDEEPVRVGGSVTPPAKIGGPDPAYTAEALAERTEGMVVVEAIIERDGTVSSTRVLHSLSRSLDEQARAAVAQWQFEPATRDGQPVRAIYTATIHFRLR